MSKTIKRIEKEGTYAEGGIIIYKLTKEDMDDDVVIVQPVVRFGNIKEPLVVKAKFGRDDKSI